MRMAVRTVGTPCHKSIHAHFLSLTQIDTLSMMHTMTCKNDLLWLMLFRLSTRSKIQVDLRVALKPAIFPF